MSLDAAYGDATGVLDPGAIAVAARSLFDAETARKPRSPLTDEHPELAVADAYAIQQAYVGLRLRHGSEGRRPQDRCHQHRDPDACSGSTRPDYGVILDDMVIGGDGTVAVDELIQPMAEPELAFELGDELRGPEVTVADVMAAARGVRACIEVIDSRIEEWRIRLADTIADNGSSARCVLRWRARAARWARPVGGRSGRCTRTATSSTAPPEPRCSATRRHRSRGWPTPLPCSAAPSRAAAVVLSGSFTTAARAAAGRSSSRPSSRQVGSVDVPVRRARRETDDDGDADQRTDGASHPWLLRRAATRPTPKPLPPSSCPTRCTTSRRGCTAARSSARSTIAERWVDAVDRLGSIWTVDHVITDPSTGRAVIEWTHFKTRLDTVLRGDEWYVFDRADRTDQRDPRLLRLAPGAGSRTPRARRFRVLRSRLRDEPPFEREPDGDTSA